MKEALIHIKINAEELTISRVETLDMLIFCPTCHQQHIDKPDPNRCRCGHLIGEHYPNQDQDCHLCMTCLTFDAWLNPPHKKHRCHYCDEVFRVADVPTNGVKNLKISSEDDLWKPYKSGHSS